MRTAPARMMPLSNVVSVREATAPKTHHPLQPVPLGGDQRIGGARLQLGPGAAERWRQLSDRALPQGMTLRVVRACRSKRSRPGSQSALIFGLGLLLVYLTLAAQYESLTLPFIILLSVPLAILGALLAQWGRGLINDVYCQIGLVMLIGLSAKNGILIVEFAEQLRARGHVDRRRRRRSRAHPAAADPDDVARVHPRRHAAGRSRAAPARRRGIRSAPPSPAA